MTATHCSGENKNMKPLQVVDQVDIKRYLGGWHEIARLPNRFQKDCFDSRADYRLREDGDLKVLNTCRQNGQNGKLNSAKGKAWIVDQKTKAKLKVRFFWPFSGDYWIIDLDKHYSYAVVGTPDRKYLWILARRPTMDENLYQSILVKIKTQGFDINKLIVEPGKIISTSNK
jgi:apolipoprotein D and lipocalin family protein